MKNNNQRIQNYFLLFFVWLALLPGIFLSVSFILLELGYLSNIALNNSYVKLCSIVIVIVLSIIFAGSMRHLLTFPNDSGNLLIVITDVLLSLALMGYVLYRFSVHHYVTPSSSVMYYVFYDYARLFHDTGLYRPALPLENPGGTWYSMLTYHPAVGASTAILYEGGGIKSYRMIFGTVSGLINVGAMAWFAMYSRKLTGMFLPGVALGFGTFAFFPVEGLAQYVAAHGSHDITMWYFSVACTSLFLMTFDGVPNRNRYSLIVLAVVTLGFAVFATSVRPYLLALGIVISGFSLYILYWAYAANRSNSANYAIKSENLSRRSLWVGVLFLLAGIYWFALLFIKYKVPVVYTHAIQFKNFSDFSGSINHQLTLLAGILTNGKGSRPWFSEIHNYFLIGSIFIVVALIFARLTTARRLGPVITLFLLLVSLPVITGTGVHWKSFYAAMILMWQFFPLLALGFLMNIPAKSLFGLGRYRVVFGISTISLVSLHILLPTASTWDELSRDEDFRHAAARLYSPGETMLVLRGGEPGGDGQSEFDGYYYWNNVFLFGDVDRAFSNRTPALGDFLCLLKSRSVKLIFNPTYQNFPNHSGAYAYDGILKLLNDNPQIFLKEIERQDGHKGIIFHVNYPPSVTEECALARQLRPLYP